MGRRTHPTYEKGGQPMNTIINTNGASTINITPEKKKRDAEMARIMARLPEKEHEKLYYMLKGSEFFGDNNLLKMIRAAAL